MRFEIEAMGPATVPALGRHNVYNALMAFAVGQRVGMDPEDIRGRLAGFRPPSLRLQLLRLGDLVILNDCYNSNPASAKAALKVLEEYPSRGRRVAVLGDMLELGKDAQSLHRELGGEASSVDWLLTTGEWGGDVVEAAVAAGLDPGRAEVFPDKAALIAALTDGLKSGDVVLLKASRAVGMEQVAQALEGRFPKGS
jgi:UDP-N-acetylmuramoyl-tripeptide--D-alanyl-D-alanine ligase